MGKGFIEPVEDEDLDLGLGLLFPGPFAHRPYQGPERGQESPARLLEAFAVRLGDALLEQEVEEGKLGIGEALLRGSALLGVEAGGQIEKGCKGSLDGGTVLFAFAKVRRGQTQPIAVGGIEPLRQCSLI